MKINLKDEQLKMVSGGVLLEGWENVLLGIMRYYKETYGKDSMQMAIDKMIESINIPAFPLDDNDIERIKKFASENWNNI